MLLSRYARPEMARIWSAVHKYEVWRRVELLALEAQATLGNVPSEAVERVRAASDFPIDDAFIGRVDEIEAEVRHDVIAFVSAYAERVGEWGRYIHHGLTSYDVVDTALSVLLVETLDLIVDGIDRLSLTIARTADQHRHTVMAGRTHGMHAEPITFGFKLAGWYTELARNRVRIEAARRSAAVGKLSGAVGTFAHIDPEVERYVCSRLGLTPAPVSTQVLGRDRHAEYACSLAVLAGTLDRFAVELRSLQRSEIRETEEPFSSGQKGSSAMPHKKNPIICERVSGLSRIVRANAQVALDNMALWHERDISNSAPERLILPESALLTDYMLAMMNRVMTGLRVFPGRMRENVEASGGIVFSQRVLLELINRGMAREQAYRVVQECALQALDGGTGFRDLIGRSPQVRSLMTDADIAGCFDYRPYIGRVDDIISRAGIRPGQGEDSND